MERMYAILLFITGLGFRVHGVCVVPPKKAGTYHNGNSAIYDTGDVLEYSCGIGYTIKYDPPISICLDIGIWNPPNVACELDASSLAIAVVVALFAISIFITIVVCIVRKGRNKRRALSPKVKRRSPKFPEYPEEPIQMSRPGSLYDSVDIGNIGKKSDQPCSTLNELPKIGEQSAKESTGLDNPSLSTDEGIDIIDAGGLNMTGAITNRKTIT